MSERDQAARILTKLKEIKLSWWYRIPDPTRCPRCGAIALGSVRPFDLIGSVEGQAYAIEFKLKKFSLEPHQDAQLRLSHASGAVSIVYVIELEEIWILRIPKGLDLGFDGPLGWARAFAGKDLVKFVEDQRLVL